ncbi:uncharacterized protein LOC144634346 [Oculina patagonica]
MFATDQHLAKSKNWYVDATFELCRHPFKQLLTVNAFMKQDDHAKQVPLLFVIMSGKLEKVYKEVFKQFNPQPQQYGELPSTSRARFGQPLETSTPMSNFKAVFSTGLTPCRERCRH